MRLGPCIYLSEMSLTSFANLIINFELYSLAGWNFVDTFIPLTCFSDSCHTAQPRTTKGTSSLALLPHEWCDTPGFSSAVSLLLSLSLSDDSLHRDFSRSLSSVPPHTNNTWAQSYVNVQDVCLHCKVIKVGVAALSWRKLRRDSWIHHNPVYLLRGREKGREMKWEKVSWGKDKEGQEEAGRECV